MRHETHSQPSPAPNSACALCAGFLGMVVSMSDAVGGAKRCSRVGRTRYCFLCGFPVESGHKFVWVPVNRKGYYRLQHRNCDFPDCYDHSPKSQLVYSARMAQQFGRRITPAQARLIEEEP